MADYTQDGLYVVSRRVIDVFFRDLSRLKEEGNWHRLRDEIIKRIHEENGALGDLVTKTFIPDNFKSETEEIKTNYLIVGFCTAYELFRRQAEANKLEKGLGN